MSVEIKCPQHERNYLLHFKAAVVDNSSNLQSWQGFNCCEWKGVGCSSHSGGHVTLLNLKDQKLGGEIHSSLFRLEYLKHLDLSHNSFSGIPIPSDIGKLKRLTFLSLFSGGFQGKIPATLANLCNLRHLELSSTDNVAKLQSPSLSVWLKSMKRLEHLTLHRVEISRAKKWNKVIASLSNLRYLRLSHCGLTGLLPSSIKNLFRLVHLDLSSNSLIGTIPSSIGHLSALAYLDLSTNQFNGTIPSTISRLANLKSLLLSSNSLTGSLSLSFFDNMTILEQLVLSHNHLTVSISSTWIPTFKKLSSLGLASCQLAKFPSFLVGQYYMSELDLSGNSMAGNIPAWIWELPMLSRLNLSSSKLTGRLPWKLEARRLRYLDLKNNSLEGTLPLPPDGVLHLDMSDNQFTASIPADIATYLQSTRVFSISGNNISGRIPDSICTKSMLVLDLSGNMLSSIIPDNFTANCSDIKVLNLGRNKLKGHIPELGKLTKLLTLEAAEELEGDPDAQMEYWGPEVGLGYGLGFFMVLGFIFFSFNVRKALFDLYDCIIVAMFHLFHLIYILCFCQLG
ncbi:hypothetical protein SUGI_0085570 [Cryptomeria japonica]|nr:hypothetical protein SUGI_0085570 [Cryptomeria japonica]